MELDAEGRRLDGRHLTYDEYIDVPALIESLRLPVEAPRGIHAARWPVRPAGWKPGDPWPRGGNWAHDEALFITTHQAFEVWFRQIRHELHDLLVRAGEIAAAHGAAIPRVHLAARGIENAPPAARLPKQLPRFVAFAETSGFRDVLLHDMPAPGVFPTGPEQEALPEGERAAARLAWFDADWPVLTDRAERAAHMLETCIPFYEVLARMTPASFLTFRDRLAPASGFGSSQFRRIELMLGLRERHSAKFAPASKARQEIEAALPRAALSAERPHREEESFARHVPEQEQALARGMLERSVRDLVYWLLRAEEFAGADGGGRWALADRLATANFRRIEYEQSVGDKRVSAVVTGDVVRDLGKVLAHSETLSAAAGLEREGPPDGLSRFLAACLRLDNALLSWRDVHVRFVERMIGARPGTGGGGLKYLRQSIAPTNEPYVLRAFPCLWEARTVLL